MLLGNINQGLIEPEVWPVLWSLRVFLLDGAWFSHGGIGHWQDVNALKELDVVFLNEQWVQLDLVANWLDAGVAEQVQDILGVEV